MKYIVLYTKKLASGEVHAKWIPSAHYQSSANKLLGQIENDRSEFDFLVIPFILTLCASLEASLNDWMIIDAFAKHGSPAYKHLSEGLCSASLAKKIRLAIAVMTDNTFQLREGTTVASRLDALVAARNKITHPQAYFYVHGEEHGAGDKSPSSVGKHPLHDLSIDDCRGF